jgi:cyclohexanone monooxygenase
MANEKGLAVELDFDLEAVRAKYRDEREKRLREDASEQYLETSGEYAHFADVDPYADPNFSRAPLTDEVDVVIIGGGFGGLFAAARLRQAGLKNVRIIEAAADFGGAWYWNRYPGAQCDIESYTYIPLLEETGYMPSEKYAHSAEIFEHCKRIGRHFNLYDLALFQTRVRELRWDERANHWLIKTNRDDVIKAQFVLTATGPVNRPKLPGIEGIHDFEGHTFHTGRWDFDYTGGDNRGGLNKLGDKKVAIIGTSSTAVQCIPHVAEAAAHLYVFQRTPCAVHPRNNAPTDPEWVKSLKPGWQKERVANFNLVVTGQPYDVDLVDDCWTALFRAVQSITPLGQKTLAEDAELRSEISDAQTMNRVRARVDRTVKDKTTAELLKPWFRVFCKRPTFHDQYLDTFNRPNVTLVDVSATKGVERITKKGVVANGVEYEVDCIIFATGFEVTTSFRRRIDFPIYGAGGVELMDYWSEGRRTLHGYLTHGFPNLFNVGPSQNGVSMNFSAVYGGAAEHIAYIISEVRKRGLHSVQPSREAESEWVETIYRLARKNKDFLRACTPGLYNNDGNVEDKTAGFLSDAYAPGLNAFQDFMAEWRAKGDLQGLEVQ